ncbi:MAG TPA: AAA family ATPase, partial [Acidimicrobiia bacterium]|nr:AAA family ATPase [Acidimicrobiia bacterium]
MRRVTRTDPDNFPRGIAMPLSSSQPPLVGREAELDALTAVLVAATGGTTKVVFIEGESGVGKTRLLTEATKLVNDRFQTLSGQGYELGRERPFGIVADALGLDENNLDPERENIVALMRGDGIRPDTIREYPELRQLPIHHLGAALVDFYEGNLDDTITALATADEIVEEVGTKVLHVWSSALGALVAIERDDLAEADHLLVSAEQHVGEAGPGMGYDWMLWARARLMEAEGDTEAAVSVLGNAWDLAESLGIVSQRRLIGPDLVRMALATDNGQRAEQAAAAMVATADEIVEEVGTKVLHVWSSALGALVAIE